MSHAHIDFETRSAAPLDSCGVEVYAEHPSTDALCLAFAIDDEPIVCWQRGQSLDVLAPLFQHVLAGRDVIAHNAAFEYHIWRMMERRNDWPKLDYGQLHCTMAQCRVLGLPASLDRAADAIRLQVRKNPRGRYLINKLSKPTSAGRWCEDPTLLAEFADYCKTDVTVERLLHSKLPPLSARERAIWLLDFKINLRGLPIDLACVDVASNLCASQSLLDGLEADRATGGAVRSVQQVAALRAWLANEGVVVPKLTASTVKSLLTDANTSAVARTMLELRKSAAKTSVAKLKAMRVGTCADVRARGLFAYYGADTGRWAGRRIQPQNLPRSSEGFDGDFCCDLLTGPEPVMSIRVWFGDTLDAMSRAIRSFIAAPPGSEFVAVDYANIEGRVLAWIAGATWKVDAFLDYDAGVGPDLYKLAYAKAFGIDVNAVTKTQRMIGKVMELALGYMGGRGAFKAMAENYNVLVISDELATEATDNSNTLTETQVDEIIKGWRTSNPEIVKLWYLVENAAIEAVKTVGVPIKAGPVTYVRNGNRLLCWLPSGRPLSYPYPSIVLMPRRSLVSDVTEWGTNEWLARAELSAKHREPFRRLIDCAGRVNASALRQLLTACADSPQSHEFIRRLDGGETRDVIECWGRDKKSYDPNTGKPTRKRWGPWRPYGGLLVENIVQAIARDVLADAMLRLDEAGFSVVGHVHDEVIVEVPAGTAALADVEKIMKHKPLWADGLPIATDGWQGRRYRK